MHYSKILKLTTVSDEFYLIAFVSIQNVTTIRHCAFIKIKFWRIVRWMLKTYLELLWKIFTELKQQKDFLPLESSIAKLICFTQTFSKDNIPDTLAFLFSKKV